MLEGEKSQIRTEENNFFGGRDSNFELFRIVLMLLIIAHHYVVNSGVAQFYDFNNIMNILVR